MCTLCWELQWKMWLNCVFPCIPCSVDATCMFCSQLLISGIFINCYHLSHSSVILFYCCLFFLRFVHSISASFDLLHILILSYHIFHGLQTHYIDVFHVISTLLSWIDNGLPQSYKSWFIPTYLPFQMFPQSSLLS